MQFFLAEIEKKYLRKREKKLTEILKILEKMLREEKPFKLNRKISFGTRWLHLALAIINFNFLLLLLLSLTLTHSYLHAHAHTLKHSLAASHFRFDTLTHPLLRATPSRPPTTSWWETKVASLSLSLSFSVFWMQAEVNEKDQSKSPAIKIPFEYSKLNRPWPL